MADYGTLFSLILAALTLVIVGIVFIVYLLMLGERKKEAKATEGLSPTEKEMQKQG